jgi:hypothetical protein
MARARSLAEFQKSFSDEESSAAFLFKRRWPDGFVCPGCGKRLSPSFAGLCVLWHVAVHGLQLAMGKGESRRHIQLAAYDFDIGAGFAGPSRFLRETEIGRTTWRATRCHRPGGH